MFELPDVMRMAQQMARHAAARQVVISENVAHADTPGYQARDLPSFGATYADGLSLRATRAGHFGFDTAAGVPAARTDPTTTTRSPNGNTVSLEHQIMRAAETRQSHDMALSVYSAARNILRTALGN
ncbi:FlgB family protein [Roseinatronobacter alkalisoli]|uniref:FlgB family protein n=1 Tax=Roseinatronobacter alkalisoli TaxID=3028235 RepID=A0ABT5T4V8_9RHOB|nr:FlgB family protein [Roseinatronobacter sp. HJB301]MDD7970151.1 FlgB family protein [Roseinatronobacter sp. HJB301]